MKKHVLAASVIVALLLCAQPVISGTSVMWWLFLAIALALYGLILAGISLSNDYPQAPPISRKLIVGGVCLFSFVGLAALVMAVSLSDARRDVSGLHNGEKVSGLPELSAGQVPLVSEEVAQRAMSRTLGEDLGLGSQFEVGQPVKQVLRGKLVWVAPLEPKSFFKALLGAESPGYVVVSAADASSVDLVRKPIEVSDRQFIGLTSRAWFSNPTRGVEDWAFEVDDAGNPFWVAGVYERQAGFFGREVKHVLTINAASGQQMVYPVGSVPEWVDNVYSGKLVVSQLNNTGELINGWFNPSDEGKFQLSGPLDLVLVGQEPWFVGTLSSQGRTEAVTESVLVNARTKQMKRFILPGITEAMAGRMLENQNPEKQLRASNPVLYQAEGVPAYVSALADSTGIVRAYGVVSATDAQMLAVGDTLSGALKQFSTRAGRAKASLGAESQAKAITGEVLVVRQEVQTHQYYMLVKVGGERFIVSAAPHLTEQLHVTVPGHTVTVTMKSSGESWTAIEFTNKSL